MPVLALRPARSLPVVLAVLAVLAPAAQGRGTAFLRLEPGPGGRVHARVLGHLPPGRHVFVLDGYRLARTHAADVSFRLTGARRPGRHRLVVRQARTHRVLASKHFTVGRTVTGLATATRAAPTLLLTATPPSSTEATTATFAFSASGGRTSCSLDGAAFARCSSPATYTGLVPGPHRFTVRATNRYGTVSASFAWSVAAAALDTTPPAAPVLSATPGDGQATLAWTGDATGVAVYAVYAADARQSDLPATARSWTATGLANGTSYSYRVVAFDAAGNSAASNTVTVTPQPPPDPAAGRELVFDDEFDGTAVDTTRWGMYRSAGHAGNGLRRPSAFTLDGSGILTLTAEMVNGTLVSGGMSRTTTQTYGYYEFRVRTETDPTGTMSGVVLTYAASRDGTLDGENDIYETLHAAGTRTPFYTFIHYPNATTGANNQYRFVHQADGTQWHVMGMDWSPTAIKIYRDGVLVWTLTDAYAIPDAPHRFAVQLDAMVNGTLTQPVRMYLDYVRIYR